VVGRKKSRRNSLTEGRRRNGKGGRLEGRIGISMVPARRGCLLEVLPYVRQKGGGTASKGCNKGGLMAFVEKVAERKKGTENQGRRTQKNMWD